MRTEAPKNQLRQSNRGVQPAPRIATRETPQLAGRRNLPDLQRRMGCQAGEVDWLATSLALVRRGKAMSRFFAAQARRSPRL